MKYMMLLSIVVWSNMAWAGQVNIPNTFTAGTKAKASEVNANFTAVKQAVDDNAAKISANTADIYANTSSVAAVQSTSASNASSVASLQTAVSNNTTKISTNTADIYANTSAISSLQASVVNNSGNIQNNASGVLGNAANISNNTTTITTNTAAIANLQASIPATYQVVDSYGNVLGDLIGASMYGQRTIISSTGFLLEFNPTLTMAYFTGPTVTMPYYGVLYTSVDCTGLPLVTTTINSGIVLGGLTGFVLNAAQGYYEGVYQNYYAPKNSISATVTANSVLSPAQTSTGTYDPYTGALITPPTYGLACITATYVDPNGNNFLQLPPYTINGYVMLPNDPAVTGVPNTIGFPLHIQKK